MKNRFRQTLIFPDIYTGTVVGLKKMGEYSYPTLGTFADALAVAQEALVTYGGVIPTKADGEKLGL